MGIYGSLCVLFLLYLVRASVAERENYSLPGTVNVERISSARSFEDLNKDSLNIVDKFRDKRALGLILSGLAQVFGYTVTPIQIASLPNPADNNAGATGNNNQSSSMPPMQSSPSPPPSSSSAPSTTPMPTTTPAPPRQRETIRFTGVVNFGNRSDLLGHLQQYERIFHGGGTMGATPPPMPSSSASSSSASSPPPPSSTVPLPNIGDSLRYKPPLLSPFLVKIPLPIAPNLPPPMSPASKMINYSYMSTPRRKEQETVYRKNEGVENYSVENKEIQSEEEVGTPESKYQHNLYIGEPYWKKLHEERIAQLERQQQEHAERLKEQERDHSYSEEEETTERSKDREKENYDREEEHSENVKEEKNESEVEDKEDEDENSRERYEEHQGYPRERYEEHQGYPRERPSNAKQEDEGAEGYKDYDDDDSNDSYKNYERYEDSKEPNSRVYENNYTNANYNQPLPISDYYEREKPPQQLRDSYGEIVNNQGLIDERIANYFDTIKNQQNGVHDSPQVPESSVNESGGKYEERYPSKGSEENDEDPYKRIRDEYAIPFIENRYEEYNIEDNERSEKENVDETENRKYVNDDDRYNSSSNANNRAQSNDSATIVDKTMQVDSNQVRSKKDKKEEIKRRNALENRMTEILENLKTRLLVE